ncbi:alpha-1B adrenergic receptor-like [Dendronephthya gigantea]|uniref:alpha-1B adrenergic receptor-like n=1 Tax=Dendronephthya gigantea TaxID=151771 RepID=UPI00106C280C|nr:alpha-1B adrenergic receptor-like [Dendronephthya gigantea]
MTNVNVSSTACTWSWDFIIPVTILFTITSFLVLFENILICVAVVCSPLREIKSNWFLVGLSVADMFTSITITPLQILEVWASPHWPLGAIGVDTYNSLWNFCLIVPFLTVLAITIDRFLVIVKERSVFQKLSLKWVFISLTCIWLYSCLIVALLALSFDQAPSNEYAWNVPYEYYYPFLAIHVLLPLLIICYCYIRILMTVRLTSQQFSSVLSSSFPLPNSKRLYEIKLAKTVGYVVLALVVVWIPVLAMEVVYALESGDSCLVKKIGIFSVWLTCTNGVINPLIYSMRSKQFKIVLKKLLKCDISGVKKDRT